MTIASIPHFIKAAALSGTAPRVFFKTALTSDEILADEAFMKELDWALRLNDVERDNEKGAFAPGGIAGVKKPQDENAPRVEGEGCIFCRWIKKD